MPEGEKRILVVTRCEPLSTFTNKRGDPQQIYEVEATDDAGVKIDEKLRSFVELQLEQPIEYDVVPYDHEKYGRSYTLKPPSKQSGLAKSVDDLRERVERMEKQNRWLFDRLVEAGLAPPAGPGPPAETPSGPAAANSRSESEDRPPAQPAAGDPSPEEEIPF